MMKKKIEKKNKFENFLSVTRIVLVQCALEKFLASKAAAAAAAVPWHNEQTQMKWKKEWIDKWTKRGYAKCLKRRV